MTMHRNGVLLVTTGSPDAPTAEAVKAYLARFLSDKRIVDLPRWQWIPILHCCILPHRPAKSAAKYAEIWRDEGSPLIVETAKQVAALRKLLADDGHGDVPVEFCCIYSAPEIDEAVERLLGEQCCDHIVVVPFYPQYASVTNGALIQATAKALTRRLRIPSFTMVDSFSDEPLYADALADAIRASGWTWVDDGHHALVFTFHSTLVHDVETGDVYREQVEETARAVAARLGLPEGAWCVGYQSVFDHRPWLGPQTETELIPQLAAQGVTELAVIAPGFVSECLETHFDVDVDQRRAFEQLVPEGTFTYVPCLGNDPQFIRALGNVVEKALRQ